MTRSRMRALPLLAVVALVAACHSGNNAPKAPPPVPVRVAAVARADVPIIVDASGVVEPMQTVNVEAQISGTILSVLFKQGDWVTKGQVLFRLDPRPQQAALAQAQANLARDEAQAVAAQHDAERYAALAAEGYVTASQSEQMQANAVATAATARADRALVQAAEVSLGYATIRAPIEGRTGSLLVRAGNLVTPGGTPLVVINQLRPIQARFPVLQTDFNLLRSALSQQALPVTATSSDSGGVTENGQVTFLDNAIDSLTGTVTGRAVFQNTNARLWPGQLVFLAIQAGVQHGVVIVPSAAVLVGQNGRYVYVIDRTKNTAQMRNVAVGRVAGDTTIVASGLAPGEVVVIDGQSRLNPGARVAISTGAAGGAGAGGAQTAAAGGAAGGTGAEATQNGTMQSGTGAQGGAGGAGGGAAGVGGTMAAGGARPGAAGATGVTGETPATRSATTAPTTVTTAPLATSPPATGINTNTPASPTTGTRATSPTTPSSATPTTSGAARPATTTPTGTPATSPSAPSVPL